MIVEICVACMSLRTAKLEGAPCPRARGKHNWQPREQPELAIDCMTCRLRTVVRGVAFMPHETHVGRVRRALISQGPRVLAFLQRHKGHEIETSAVTPTMAQQLAQFAQRRAS